MRWGMLIGVCNFVDISRGSCARGEKGRGGGSAARRCGCSCGIESEWTHKGPSIAGPATVPEKSQQSSSGSFLESSRELEHSGDQRSERRNADDNAKHGAIHRRRERRSSHQYDGIRKQLIIIIRNYTCMLQLCIIILIAQWSEVSSLEPQLKQHESLSLLQSCWNCGRPALETCGGCGIARYCGFFCQHRDWEASHHTTCNNNLPPREPRRSTSRSPPRIAAANLSTNVNEDVAPPVASTGVAKGKWRRGARNNLSHRSIRSTDYESRWLRVPFSSVKDWMN
jgi:hypothetical protein